MLAKDRELFAEQQAEERKSFINALNKISQRMEYTTLNGESQRSGSENKLGLMYELAMEQKLQSIVSSDFPHLVLHEIQTRRLYNEKDPHFATTRSTLGEVAMYLLQW